MTDYFSAEPQDLRVLITVKTYPTLSTKYAETVCTAGISDDGKWVRLYPIPFRKIEDFNNRYKKYSWVNIRAIRNHKKDFRVESFRPVDINSISVEEPIPTKNDPGWSKRRSLVLDKVPIYTNLKQLWDDAYKEIPVSLAIFKPTRILDFYWEPDERQWNQKKVFEIENQLSLFDENNEGNNPFKVVDKLPYTFKYRFEDDEGRVSNNIITDWETGMLYWNSLRNSCSDEEACQKVRQRYFNDFTQKDAYFYMGTIWDNHQKKRKNPFSIIGVFYPPYLPDGFTKQLNLFDDL